MRIKDLMSYDRVTEWLDMTDPVKLAELYSGQADYDHAISLQQVKSIIDRDFKPWKCSTIHEKYGAFVDCGKYKLKGLDSSQEGVGSCV